MVAIDEDFFILVRISGARTRVLLSDVTAADEWDLATSAVEHLENLGLPIPDDDEDAGPAGHLDLLSDLGVPEAELIELVDEMLDDDEAVPRRGALGHRAAARLRRAVRRRRRPHLGLTDSATHAATAGTPRCGSRSTRRGRRSRPATSRSARSSSTRDGEVVGRGRNVREAQADPTGHAEVVALREAAAPAGSGGSTAAPSS